MMRKISFRVGVFLMCMLLVLSPSVALGEDRELEGGLGVGWAGEVEGGNYAVHARALNKYNAACWAMGVNPLTISTANRSKLSDPNYGGDFYVYAQSFTNIIGWDDVPGWMPTYATLTFVLYGFDNQWASEVSKSLYDSAKVDFKRVLAGEDLGGGGETPTPSGNVPSSLELDIKYGNLYVNYAARPMSGYTFNVSFASSALNTVNNYARSLPYYYPMLCYYNPTKKIQFKLLLTNKPCEIVVGTSYGGRPNLTYKAADGSSYNYRLLTIQDVYLTDVLRGSAVSLSVGSWWSNSGGSSSSYEFIDGEGLAYSDPWSTPVVVPPSGTWPEPVTPVTPDPPEVPTPTAPTVTPDPEPTQPTPTWPDITINIPSAPTVEVTPTGLDYTELLTRINDNLNTINSYTVSINSGLNSLRSDLVTEFESVEQALRNIYQFLQHMDSMLERHCQHLRDALSDCTHHLELYMKELFEWLPRQLNYDAEFEYDDSGVIGWLKNIYYKLGGGTSAPNPIADPSGFFDWLLGLITGFLASLLAGLPGKVQELLSDLTDLTEYFPFSAPWDLYGLLLLFAHDPVIPVFTIPWGFGSGRSADIVIDCTQWDGVMSVVRSVEKIIFAGGLAKLTFDMFRPTDVTGD